LRLRLITVASKAPAWVEAGLEDYAKRLSAIGGIDLVEIRPADRARGGDVRRWLEDEAKRVLAAIPKGAWVVALDERGRQWSSQDLAARFDQWRAVPDLALLVGGPDGLGESCLSRANEIWSLSVLTCPHALVRVIVAEQLYRAWSLLHNHPYHRA
jgi:23S rRNA (pseudouridine1915-N3)-methyltransferase